MVTAFQTTQQLFIYLLIYLHNNESNKLIQYFKNTTGYPGAILAILNMLLKLNN